MEPEDDTHLWQVFCRGEDPTAFNRLFDRLHTPLLQRLRNKFPTLPAEDLVDAVADAFLSLVTNPKAFDPARGPLLPFLFLVADRNLTDRWRKDSRHPVVSLHSLEGEGMYAEPRTDRAMIEDGTLTRLAYGDADPAETLSPPVVAWLKAVLPDTRDRDLFLMTADDRLDVETFARLYKVQTRPLSEQRRDMKRHRDRVQKRVRRDGAKLWQIIHGDEPLPARFIVSKGGADRTP